MSGELWYELDDVRLLFSEGLVVDPPEEEDLLILVEAGSLAIVSCMNNVRGDNLDDMFHPVWNSKTFKVTETKR